MRNYFDELEGNISSANIDTKILKDTFEQLNQYKIGINEYRELNHNIDDLINNIHFDRQEVSERKDKNSPAWKLILPKRRFVKTLLKHYGYSSEKEFLDSNKENLKKLVEINEKSNNMLSSEEVSRLISLLSNSKNHVVLLGFLEDNYNDKLYLNFFMTIIFRKLISIFINSQQYQDYVVLHSLGVNSQFNFVNTVDKKITEVEYVKAVLDFLHHKAVNSAHVKTVQKLGTVTSLNKKMNASSAGVQPHLNQLLQKIGCKEDSMSVDEDGYVLVNGEYQLDNLGLCIQAEDYDCHVKHLALKEDKLVLSNEYFHTDQDANFAGYLPEIINHKDVTSRVFGYLTAFNEDVLSRDSFETVAKKYNLKKKISMTKAITYHNHVAKQINYCLPELPEGKRALISHRKKLDLTRKLVYLDTGLHAITGYIMQIDDYLWEQFGIKMTNRKMKYEFRPV